MSHIQQQLQQVLEEIANTTQACHREAGSVQLLAVSKTKPVEDIENAIKAGQLAFGENYVQEGIEKVQYFQDKYADTPLDWHFIGPIQSNKTRPVAEHFSWVHTIDRVKIAQRLNDQRPASLGKLNVLIQVNTSGEQSKSGVSPEDVATLAKEIEQMPNLILRGLMSIPESVTSYEEQLNAFMTLATIKETLVASHPQIDTLSMGMSGDLKAAIAAGSTIVRIGTAIFGQRNYN